MDRSMFSSGGLIPTRHDAKMVVLERGWWMCKKCGTIFESYIIPPLKHVCHVKRNEFEYSTTKDQP
jgi:rubrerythrin